MNRLIKNMIVGLAAAAMLLSCDLNLYPTTAVVYDENQPMIQSESDADQYLMGVLASYRSLQYGSFTQSIEVMLDGFNATSGFGNNYGSIHRLDVSFSASDDYVESMWGSHYLAIKNYNIAIEQTETGKIPEELEEYVSLLRGVSLFCRASSYLTLARIFGPDYDPETAETDLCVPLVLKYEQYAKPLRATVQEVYDQIRNDLGEAEFLLEDISGEAGAMMPTIDAVQALFARYYLDVEDYESAWNAAAGLADSDTYALASTPSEMDTEWTYDSGTEPIIQLFATMAEGVVANPLYTNVSSEPKDGMYYTPYFIPTKKLVDAYDDTDLRKDSWFDAPKIKMNGSFYNEKKDTKVFIKYLHNPNLSSSNIPTGAHAAKPLLISEMYLIAAEAYAMDGKPVMARTYLNKLQRARGAVQTSGDKENIKKEWFRETVGEGLRLSCIKRWGDGVDARTPQTAALTNNLIMVEPVSAYTERPLDADSHLLNWPVPTYEIRINPGLVQNDGYGIK